VLQLNPALPLNQARLAPLVTTVGLFYAVNFAVICYVLLVARQYVHALPTAGNDLLLVGFLAFAGLTMGALCGFATHVRAGGEGIALTRVGWLAGILLAAGIGARMMFAFALGHGAEPAIRSFSIAHQIGAAAWPVALVSMAVCEVVARLVIVQIRGHRLTTAPSAVATGARA